MDSKLHFARNFLDKAPAYLVKSGHRVSRKQKQAQETVNISIEHVNMCVSQKRVTKQGMSYTHPLSSCSVSTYSRCWGLGKANIQRIPDWLLEEINFSFILG